MVKHKKRPRKRRDKIKIFERRFERIERQQDRVMTFLSSGLTDRLKPIEEHQERFLIILSRMMAAGRMVASIQDLIPQTDRRGAFR